MTKKQKQLFDTMMEAIYQKDIKELDFLIAKREYEEARKAYLEYAPEPSLEALESEESAND